MADVVYSSHSNYKSDASQGPQSSRMATPAGKPSGLMTQGAKEQLAQFDKTKHQIARYDVYGNIKPQRNRPDADSGNILTQDVRIPDWWSKDHREENKMTTEKLNNKRRNEFIPHISYDLDGDGIVSGRDLVLAKHFDKDQDGRLNTGEKKAAMDALKQGYEDQFVWGIEQSGAQRPYRIMQKRGEIVDADDFLPVGNSYPIHPDTTKKPMNATVGDMMASRQKNDRRWMDKKKQDWDDANPTAVERKYIHSEFLVDQPNYKTRSQMIEEKRRVAREAAGLTSEGVDIKNHSRDPQVGYRDKPDIFSQSALVDARKKDQYDEFKKIEKIQGNHRIGMERLNEREECLLRQGYIDSEMRKTQWKIQNKRKSEDIEYNMKTFGKQSLGVHGQELPKFSEESVMKEYWKIKDGFSKSPNNVSRKQMLQERKYWAKNDEVYLADVREEEAPQDDFKLERVQQTRKDGIQEKVNNIKHFKEKDEDVKEIDPANPPPQHNYRWTTLENNFNRRKNRLFEDLPPAKPERADFDPLYSSFHPKGIFNDPKTSKDPKVQGIQEASGNATGVQAATMNKSHNSAGIERSQVKSMTAKRQTAPEDQILVGAGITNMFSRFGHATRGQGSAPSQGAAIPRSQAAKQAPESAQNRTATGKNPSFKDTTSIGVRSGGFRGFREQVLV